MQVGVGFRKHEGEWHGPATAGNATECEALPLAWYFSARKPKSPVIVGRHMTAPCSPTPEERDSPRHDALFGGFPCQSGLGREGQRMIVQGYEITVPEKPLQRLGKGDYSRTRLRHGQIHHLDRCLSQ